MRTVADVLAEVERTAAAESDRQSAELAEVEQQIVQVRGELASLEQQLSALTTVRDQLERSSSAQRHERLARAHHELFEVLREQAAGLGAREGALQQRSRQHLEGIEAQLETSSMAPLLQEYTSYIEAVEPTLAGLPESYRSAVVQHHQRLKTRLAQHIQALAAQMPPLEQVEPLSVELVYAVDAPEGTDELLIVVVPVSDQIVVAWPERKGGLQTWLAARVVQPIYEAGKLAGFPQAQPTYGGYQGLVAVELELDVAPEGFVGAFEERLRALLGSAAELRDARVDVEPQRLHVDVVSPPEVDEHRTPMPAPGQEPGRVG